MSLIQVAWVVEHWIENSNTLGSKFFFLIIINWKYGFAKSRVSSIQVLITGCQMLKVILLQLLSWFDPKLDKSFLPMRLMT